MKIVPLTDFSEDADRAPAAGIRPARALGPGLRLLHVVGEPGHVAGSAALEAGSSRPLPGSRCESRPIERSQTWLPPRGAEARRGGAGAGDDCADHG